MYPVTPSRARCHTGWSDCKFPVSSPRYHAGSPDTSPPMCALRPRSSGGEAFKCSAMHPSKTGDKKGL